MSLRAPSFLSVLALAALSVASCGGGSVVPNAKPDAATPDGGDASDVAPDVNALSEGGDVSTEAREPSTDSGRDGRPCDAAPLYCLNGATSGGVGICNDIGPPAICDDGTWRCPFGAIEMSKCTCTGPQWANCTCTRTGWVCTDVDGGADAAAAGDASPDAMCAAGCESTTTGTFCNAGEVQWTCQPGQFNPTSFNAHCRDAATNAVRYCCPTTFRPLCD